MEEKYEVVIAKAVVHHGCLHAGMYGAVDI